MTLEINRYKQQSYLLVFLVDFISMFILLINCCRIHPLNVLLALKSYEKGKPANVTKTQTQWKVNADVAAALDCAFYKSFKVIEY